MRLAVITGPGLVEIRHRPDPVPADDEILVQVGACGLCTMERRLFLGERRVYPVAPGHEVAGRVVALGAAVAQLPAVPTLGDLVAVDLLTRCGACGPCRRGRSALCQAAQGATLDDGTISMGAGLADFVRVAADQAWRCGDVPVAHAAMAEPLACVAHSVRLGGFRAGDRVAVVGGGFMGRLHVALTRALGAATVGIVDVSLRRRTDALDHGAHWAVHPDDAADLSGRLDLAFVTVGVPGALELAISLCDLGGAVVVYGAFPKDHHASIVPDAIHHRELTILGSYSHEPEDWRTATGWIASGRLAAELDALVSARYSLDEVAAALRTVAESSVYRVLVGSP